LGAYGQHPVSRLRSSNPTYRFPVSGSPTGFTARPTAGQRGAGGAQHAAVPMDLIVREPAVAAVGSVSGRRAFGQFVRGDRGHSLANPATATSAPHLYWSGAQRRCPSRAAGPVVKAFCRCWFAWWGRPRPRGEPLRSEHFPPAPHGAGASSPGHWSRRSATDLSPAAF